MVWFVCHMIYFHSVFDFTVCMCSQAKKKRRIVLGLREVTKHLRLKKIKCVIISPNLERIQSKGSLLQIRIAIFRVWVFDFPPTIFQNRNCFFGKEVRSWKVCVVNSVLKHHRLQR